MVTDTSSVQTSDDLNSSNNAVDEAEQVKCYLFTFLIDNCIT